MKNSEKRAAADELRKKIKVEEKKIFTAQGKKIDLVRQVEAIEKTCTHLWEDRVFDQKLGKFTRTCEFCGKFEISRDIQTRF